jgi:hypothetical protein
MKMRSFWPLLMAGSVGAMGVQAGPDERHPLLMGPSIDRRPRI